MGTTEHPQDTASPCTDQNRFYYPFRPLFDRRPVERNRVVKNGLKWSIKNCIWSIKDETILLERSVMLNYQLQIVGDEFVTSIGHDDGFYVNLLFDRSIYRTMCTHMGKSQ